MTEIILIAAVAQNGVIGKDGSLPWDLPEDHEHFRATTEGHPVIMGRRTWEDIEEGLGGPLPGRTNIVVSHEDLEVPEEVINVHGIEEAIEVAGDMDEQIFVIGGASIYEQFLEHADAMILSELHDAYEGDTRFPDWGTEDWEEVERDQRERFDIVRYRRTG